MKRLFPRAVPEAVIALLVLGACSPTSNVKSGAPVLTMLTIVSPGSTPAGVRVDVTPDTALCPDGYAENMNCDPGTPVCELGANVVCHCDAKDMCDPSITPDAAVTGGTLNCTYPPLSYVVATFDRLLDTTPFEPTTMTSVATLTSVPATATPLTTTAAYTSTGSTTGLIFTNFILLTGGYAPDITGPAIALMGSPALPTGGTVTIALDSSTVQAKDKKTAFTGVNLLANGKLAFKTSSFSASITPPAPPPPMSMDMGTMMPMGCPDAGTPPPASTDGGADAPASEGGAGGSDGGTDAPALEVGATTDAAATTIDAALPTDAGVALDAGSPSDAGATTDSGTATPPAAASTDVPSDMNTATIEIDFTNLVDMTILPTPDAGTTTQDGGATMTDVTMTEDGAPFTDFAASMDTTFPTATVKIAPSTMWAAGKTYTITVSADTTDVVGDKLGAPVTATFTMSAN